MTHLNKVVGASALAIFAAVGFAGSASAQETIRGQGATLPAGLYADWFANPGPNADYAFSYNAPLVRRSGGTIPANTGSGAGKAAFASHTFNNNTWTVGGTTQPLPSDVTTAQKEDIQFAGSDAILTTTDLANYNSARWGDPIQVPSVGTPVTLAFNKSGIALKRKGATGLVSSNGKQDTNKVLYLSRASYCGIFTGGITRWDDALITRDNGRVVAKEEIKVVVRSDSSGTTEIFSRHLDTVCDGSEAAGGFTFPATNTADPNTPTGRTTITWSSLITEPGRLIAAAGSGGVSTAVANNRYSIGYVSPDYTDIVANPAPGAGSPPPATANLQNQADIDKGKNNNFDHSASFKNVRSAQNGIEAPLLTDSAIVWGQKLALLDTRANNPTAGTAYPIVGYTFMNFYTCYPKAKGKGVIAFAKYLVSGEAADKAIAAGFAPLAGDIRAAVSGRLLAKGSSPRGVTAGKVNGYCSL
jgi:phosphate transport system substrate-binding protein